MIAVGFIAAFVTAILVVRSLLDFVSSRGYAPFAYWRIVIGVVGLLGLLFWPSQDATAVAALAPGF